jgi:hypothetical protein
MGSTVSTHLLVAKVGERFVGTQLDLSRLERLHKTKHLVGWRESSM